MVYMDGLRPFFLRILMEVSVTKRKTSKATERPTNREKSVASISWWAEREGIYGGYWPWNRRANEV